MRLKVIGACMAAMSICLPVAQAQTATIGEVIAVMGDLLAIATLCPDYDVNAKIWSPYLEENGITKRLITGEISYAKDVDMARDKSFQDRKAMSVADNCKDALRLYGEKGTVLPNLMIIRKN